MKQDPCQIIHKFAEKLNLEVVTINCYMQQIEKVKKLDKCVHKS